MEMDKELLRIAQDSLEQFARTFSHYKNSHGTMESIISAAVIISETISHGGTLFIAGNGGSAADAQHMAAEFVVRLHSDDKRRGLPARALTTDTSVITACANDFGFEKIFERQVDAYAGKEDLFLGISTSGQSKNIVNALKKAKEQGCRSILLTGPKGSRISGILEVRVPGESVRDIQMLHLFSEHILVEMTLYLLSKRGYI